MTMMITIAREQYTTDGWQPLPVLTLLLPPTEADDLARERHAATAHGPIAPTDEEIETACIRRYRRSDGSGTLNVGDVAVTRVVVEGS